MSIRQGLVNRHRSLRPNSKPKKVCLYILVTMVTSTVCRLSKLHGMNAVDVWLIIQVVQLLVVLPMQLELMMSHLM